MRPDQLTEALGSTRSAADLRGPALAEAPVHRILFSISGPGFSDSEEFEIADVRTARASARKLVAHAIRLFGRTDAGEND
jgi:hypothetical protein